MIIKKVTENLNFVKTLAEVLLSATQNIGQQAHESSASSNRGTF